jgi:hypothetical protein
LHVELFDVGHSLAGVNGRRFSVEEVEIRKESSDASPQLTLRIFREWMRPNQIQ